MTDPPFIDPRRGPSEVALATLLCLAPDPDPLPEHGYTPLEMETRLVQSLALIVQLADVADDVSLLGEQLGIALAATMCGNRCIRHVSLLDASYFWETFEAPSYPSWTIIIGADEYSPLRCL